MDEQHPSKLPIQELSIVNLLTKPALILDDSLVTVVGNSAFYATLGISPGEVEGRPVQELIAASDCHQALRMILECVLALGNEWEHVHSESVITPSTLGTLSVTSRRVNLIEQPGDLIVVELHDITAEPETERRLREMNDALIRRSVALERLNSDLESFNRWVSHDLRTPLRATQILVHRLLENHDPTLPPPVLDTVRLILKCTHEMGSLVDDLLAFSQVDRLPLRRRRTNIARLARKALAKLNVEVEDIQRLRVSIDELPACHADPALMQQVLLNLLSNAITSTSFREKGEVRLGFQQDECEGTVYFVRDNGVGFDSSEAELFFRPFYTARRVRAPQGMGVGLTLVQRIIERHGGRIWAEGEPGRGATFYFQLGEEPTTTATPGAGRSAP